MNPELPSESELDTLALQVDSQLLDLQSQAISQIEVRSGSSGQRSKLPAAPKQQAVIEQATNEPFEGFWEKLKRHARRDLCLPDGHLYQQWQKWRDLRSKDSVKIALGFVAGIGIPTASVAPVAVAASVFLLNVVTNIGIEAICEDCNKEIPRNKALRKPAKKKQNS